MLECSELWFRTSDKQNLPFEGLQLDKWLITSVPQYLLQDVSVQTHINMQFSCFFFYYDDAILRDKWRNEM